MSSGLWMSFLEVFLHKGRGDQGKVSIKSGAWRVVAKVREGK